MTFLQKKQKTIAYYLAINIVLGANRPMFIQQHQCLNNYRTSSVYYCIKVIKKKNTD